MTGRFCSNACRVFVSLSKNVTKSVTVLLRLYWEWDKGIINMQG